jgi:hypothetical protein
VTSVDTVLARLAETACKRVATSVIRSLQRMTDGMQSGADTQLKNVWDEVCVQVQGQESVFWEEAYLPTMKALILKRLEKEDAHIKQAIWLQTDEGMRQCDDDESFGFTADEAALADYILSNYVLSAASDWTNSRIERDQARSTEYDLG